MVAWKAVSKTATCGTSGSAALASPMAARAGTLCKRERRQRLELGDDLVVDQRRVGEATAAVHDTVPDRLGQLVGVDGTRLAILDEVQLRGSSSRR